jgi:hypothetical protein
MFLLIINLFLQDFNRMYIADFSFDKDNTKINSIVFNISNKSNKCNSFKYSFYNDELDDIVDSICTINFFYVDSNKNLVKEIKVKDRVQWEDIYVEKKISANENLSISIPLYLYNKKDLIYKEYKYVAMRYIYKNEKKILYKKIE